MGTWHLRTDQEITEEINNLNRVIATKGAAERKYLEAQKEVLEVGLRGDDIGRRVGRTYEDTVLKWKTVDGAAYDRALYAFCWLLSVKENAPSNFGAHGSCEGR